MTSLTGKIIAALFLVAALAGCAATGEVESTSDALDNSTMQVPE